MQPWYLSPLVMSMDSMVPLSLKLLAYKGSFTKDTF